METEEDFFFFQMVHYSLNESFYVTNNRKNADF